MEDKLFTFKLSTDVCASDGCLQRISKVEIITSLFIVDCAKWLCFGLTMDVHQEVDLACVETVVFWRECEHQVIGKVGVLRR